MKKVNLLSPVFRSEDATFTYRSWALYRFIALEAVYNLNSKNDLEKLLLRDFNASVEFFYHPTVECASSFRILQDSLDKNRFIEISYISNHEEVIRFNPENRLNQYKVETFSFSINVLFAEKLYKRVVLFIDNFKAKGQPLIFLDGYSTTFRAVVEDEVWSLSVDGYSATFRVVVEDEVWSLWIHEPQGNSKKMADLCRQIITDAQNSQLDESKYISILDTIEFENK